MKLFEELKRRNVFRVAGVYAVVGWLLAQVSATLENAIGLPSWFDGLVVALLLVGFPIAMILAWAFEMTPDGVKLTANVPEGESIAPKTGRKLDYAILGGLALVGAMIVADRFSPEPSSFETRQQAGAPQDEGSGQAANTPPHPEELSATAESVSKDAKDASIAVLPFADLSPGKDQEYFSQGIAEEILNVLANVSGLEVASRTSSFQFKGQEKIGIPLIAEQLHMRHVLEGSVRKAGDTMLLYELNETARDLADGDMRWAVDMMHQAMTNPAYDKAAALRVLEARLDGMGSKLEPESAMGGMTYLLFGAYDRMRNKGDSWWWTTKGFPDWKASPERKQWMREQGLDVYWRKHGFPPQCKPLGKDDFECE